MGEYLGKNKNRQDTGTPTFTASLFKRASTWIKPKYTWKEKMDKRDVVHM